ncbi:MAG: hypothetical protein ACJLS3_12165 [Erythrobacter sp.]
MTDAEYQSMNNGINIVFGAVLGVVLTRTEDLSAVDFMFVLATSAIAVSQILALGIHERRLQYIIGAVAAIALLPLILQSLGIPPIPKLQPTLIVWTAMVLLVELSPRKQPSEPKPEQETPA